MKRKVKKCRICGKPIVRDSKGRFICKSLLDDRKKFPWLYVDTWKEEQTELFLETEKMKKLNWKERNLLMQELDELNRQAVRCNDARDLLWITDRIFEVEKKLGLRKSQMISGRKFVKFLWFFYNVQPERPPRRWPRLGE